MQQLKWRNMLRTAWTPSLWALVLSLLLFGFGLPAAAQLNATQNGAPLNQGDSTTIDKYPFMPNLVFSINGGLSCDIAYYYLVIQYSDQGGLTTGGTYTPPGGSFLPGDQEWDVDWGNSLEGGNATLTWQVDNIGPNVLNFFVIGSNPDVSTINTEVSVENAPWFYPNMLTAESSYMQFTGGYPSWGPPHGIGLSQIDPPNNDLDYWDWQLNIDDGLAKLASMKTPAYSFWNSQITQWQTDAAGPSNPVPQSCNYQWCCFAYPQGPLDSYGDAEWIKAYNGATAYYISWINSHPNTADGHWSINDSAGYVGKVCNATPPNN